MARKKNITKRKFNGKQYRFIGSRGSKKKAQQFAKGKRSQGYNARVVKDEHSPLYLIYQRRTKRVSKKDKRK